MNDRKQGTAPGGVHKAMTAAAGVIPDDALARARETAVAVGAKVQEEAASAKVKAEEIAPQVAHAAQDMAKRAWPTAKRAWPVVTAVAGALAGALAATMARIRREDKRRGG